MDFTEMFPNMLLSIVVVLAVRPPALVKAEEGSCPPSIPVDICSASCGPRVPCEGRQVCCPTACGGAMCVDAVTKRHFVNQIKKGSCPESPAGPWICSDTCTGDSDCPRTLKCCANRCGAMACQRPMLESLAPTPDNLQP